MSIPLLAQAVMAMGLGRPDFARARPSSLLKRDDDYRKIFSSTVPLEIYLWLAESQKSVDAYLLSEEANATPQERTNLRFHLAMMAAVKLTGDRVRALAQLREVATEKRAITDADLSACLATLRESFASFKESSGDTDDKIVKGVDFVDYLLAGPGDGRSADRH